jgi:hypothetical protein
MIVMMRNRNFLLLLLGALLPFSAFAQTGAAESVFAPFVSQLSVETRNNLARLSWIDSPDIRGPVYIFRAPQPFETGRIPENIRPQEVPYGTQSFIDETEGTGRVYYFVAASDGLGQRYDIVIPYNNTISVTINGSDTARVSPPEGQNLRPVESGLFGLETRAGDEGVHITYRTAGGRRNIVLYRSVQPLRNTADLLRAVIIYSGAPAPFTDYPAPGIPYYYAVIFEDEQLQGTMGLIPGHNASIEPVEINAAAGMAGPAEPARPIRAMPLPLISVYNVVPGSDGFSGAPAAVPLGPDAAKALEAIPRPDSGPPPKKKARAFSRDLEAPAAGEDSRLRAIVQETFVKQDWQGARTELLNYLSLPPPPLVEARARFYLGQACYFTGRNREALIEFLMIQSQYPREAREWIDAVLTAMIY